MSTEVVIENSKRKRAELGYNMLCGITPECTRDDGIKDEFTVRMGSDNVDLSLLDILTQHNDYRLFDKHIDIDGGAFTLLYDLGSARNIDNIYFSSYAGGGSFSFKTAEIYASDTKDNLFKEENLVAFLNNSDGEFYSRESRRDCVNIYTKSLCARYIAFRQKSTNSKDGISRIANFGVYSKEYDNQYGYVRDNYKDNLIGGTIAKVSGIVSGKAEFLTDKLVFDNATETELSNAEITVELPYERPIDHIIIIGRELGNVSVKYDESGFFAAEYVTEPAICGRNTYNLLLKDFSKTKTVTLRIDTAKLDQILVFSELRELKADTNNVMAEDFIGVGANVIPTHLFEGSRREGFNEAYMALEARRVSIAKPAVVRVWFQLDWFILDEESYYKRQYAFNTSKMYSVFKELDALKAAGAEVLLNYGWKIGTSMQSWFSFPEVFNKRASAPKDLKQYAISCSDCLKELIINRGYDNIKYLAMFNEANSGYPGGWDFQCPEGYDVKAYWGQMLTLVDEQLRKDGLRDRISICAAETAGDSFAEIDPITDWIDYFNKNYGDKYECATYHQYSAEYDRAKSNTEDYVKHAGKHKAIATEFSAYSGENPVFDMDNYDFNHNNISDIMGCINGGISGGLYWTLSGGYIDEGFFLNIGEDSFWDSVIGGGKPNLDGVSRTFYELSILTNYLPRHCKTIKVDGDYKDIHTAAFIKDDDYAIAVDTDKCHYRKKLVIDLGKKLNKPLYKYVYKLDVKMDGNLIIPPCSGVFEVEDTLSDVIDPEYAFVVYSTIKPRSQVVMERNMVEVKAGQSVKLNAKVIDGEQKLTWSMCDAFASCGFGGTITPDGVFTADKTFLSPVRVYGMDALYAAKAETENGEYGVCLIKLV